MSASAEPRHRGPSHRFHPGRALNAWAVALTLMTLACRQARSAPDGPVLAPESVDPGHRDAWERVERARAEGRAPEEVAAAAEQVLARGPPPVLVRAARHVLAEQAYRRGADADAVVHADAALAVGGRDEELRPTLLLRARALARGGDPEAALAAVQRLVSADREGVDGIAIGAVAADRAHRNADALLGYVRWRARVEDAAIQAGWIERRIAALGETVAVRELMALSERVDAPRAKACLRARAGRGAPPPWGEACSRSARRIGALVPQRGPLAALGEAELGAAAVALGLLQAQGFEVDLLVRDAGGATESIAAAAQELAGLGVEAIVGPVGTAAVSAAAVAGRPLWIPAESIAGARGTAPSLEPRIAALVGAAASAGRRRLSVLVPDNAYGRRALDAASKAAQKHGLKMVKTKIYSPATTSFAPIVQELGDEAILIADQATRLELVARQLARQGRTGTPADGGLLATAEGIGLGGLGGRALEPALLAPAVAWDPGLEAFALEYERIEGRPPTDHAALTWAALERAVRGNTDPVLPTLARVEQGRLVALAPIPSP